MITYCILLSQHAQHGLEMQCRYIQNSAIPNLMGASVSSGAHSGLVVVCFSAQDELLPLLTRDSINVEQEGDEGRRECRDSFGLVADSA